MGANPSSPPPLRFVVVSLLAFTASALGCDPYDVDSESELDRLDRTGYPTLALAPLQLYMEHRPYQAFQYAYDVLEILSLEGRIPVVAPWEYDPEGELDPGGVPYYALMALAERSEIRLTEVALLELRIDEASTARSVQAPVMMGGSVEHQYQSDVSITLTVREFPHGDRLARVAVTFEDPLLDDSATPANPRPVLREGLCKAARQLVELVQERWSDPPPGALPNVDVIYNPRQMFTYRGAAGEALEGDFAGMDELDRLANRLVYYQYFEPDISGGTLRFFESSEPGLLVREVDEESGRAGLAPDDYITAVNGGPIHGIHSFARAFLLTPVGGEVRLELVQRGQPRLIRLLVGAESDGYDPDR